MKPDNNRLFPPCWLSLVQKVSKSESMCLNYPVQNTSSSAVSDKGWANLKTQITPKKYLPKSLLFSATSIILVDVQVFFFSVEFGVIYSML